MNLGAKNTPVSENQALTVGRLGEHLVAGWLQAQNAVILHHRWRCRWGEIDLIVQRQPVAGIEKLLSGSAGGFLSFVEVKTRSRGNWDAEGLLAITPAKQAKIWQTAQLFLAERPDLANLPCRFDVALVTCQRLPRSGRHDLPGSPTKVVRDRPIQLGQPVLIKGYRLCLHDYIESAFD